MDAGEGNGSGHPGTAVPPGTRHYYDGDSTRYDAGLTRVHETQRNLWTERLWWRRGVFGCLGVMVILLGVVIYVTTRQTYAIEFVQVNTEGQLTIVGWDQYQPSDEEMKQDLMRWLRCVRGLPPSQGIVDYCWTIIPMFLRDQSQALQMVSAYWRELNPHALLYRKEIDVRDLKAWKHPDGRWQLRWIEDVFEIPRHGGVGKRELSTEMNAILVVTRMKPKSRKQTHLKGEPVNPRGVIISALSWGE